MKYPLLVNRILINLFVITVFMSACDGRRSEKQVYSKVDGNRRYYNDIFGKKYYVMGRYIHDSEDSVETNLWFFSGIDTSMVIYGKYTNGFLLGEWRFGFDDGTFLSSQWMKYENYSKKCALSLPFQYDETNLDSSYFRLKTMNDSLGKISIIVGVSDTVVESSGLPAVGKNTESALRERGYSIQGEGKKIVKAGNVYFFGEYFMKDPDSRDCKLYYLYGYTPSKSHFVEILFFHDGPKEEVVKIIYNLLAMSIYINGERFFNPYLKE